MFFSNIVNGKTDKQFFFFKKKIIELVQLFQKEIIINCADYGKNRREDVKSKYNFMSGSQIFFSRKKRF